VLISTAQLQTYIDQRLIAEYLSDLDTGVPVPVANFSTNTILLNLIESASQDVISAVNRANQYTIDEIVSLAGDRVGDTLPLISATLPFVPSAPPAPQTVESPFYLVGPVGSPYYTPNNSYSYPGIGEGLRSCVSGLIWGKLLDRRKLASDDYERLANSYKIADSMLQRLTLGERVWFIPGDGAAQAGLPSVVVLGACAPCQIATKIGLWGRSALYPYGGYGGFDYSGPGPWGAGGN